MMKLEESGEEEGTTNNPELGADMKNLIQKLSAMAALEITRRETGPR